VEISGVFAIIIYTGINQNPLKPALQCHGDLEVPVFIKLVYILEKLCETFIYNLFNLILVMLVTIADFHGISLQEFI
jgi:hypothetical protein